MTRALVTRWIPSLVAIVLMAAAWAVQAQALAPGRGQPPALQLQPIPSLTGRVIDTTGTLSAQDQAAIDGKLAALEHDTGAQVVLLVVPTTAPEDIAAYANRVGNTWKIGRKNVGDGLVLLVAKNDRRVRIDVAQTLQGAVPDIAAGRIIQDVISPAFRRGDYAGGLSAAVDQIDARIRGEPLPPVAAQPQGEAGRLTAGPDWGSLLGLLFLIGVTVGGGLVRGVLGRGLGAVVTGAVAGGLAWLLTASLVIAIVGGLLALLIALFAGLASALPMSRGRGGWNGPVFLPGNGGFGGGGLGGGGFSSGGGGDFNGGGASGSW